MYLSFHTPIFPLGIIDDGLSNDKKLIGSGQRTPLVFSNLCYKKNSIERIPRFNQWKSAFMFKTKAFYEWNV